MKIDILHLVEGARKARGLCVVIDVFRAFSVAAYAVDKGAAKIIPVEKVETAFQLKEQNPGYILMGERNEQKIPGFDLGNSPSHVQRANLKGKTVVHTTSAGTRGLVNSMHTEEVLTGAFVNASSIARYIKKRNPAMVSLVCMGYAGERPVEEDTLCAEFIKNALSGYESDFENYVRIIRNTSGKRFFDPERQSYAPSGDFNLCLNLNRFNFVLKAEKKGKYIQLVQLKV